MVAQLIGSLKAAYESCTLYGKMCLVLTGILILACIPVLFELVLVFATGSLQVIKTEPVLGLISNGAYCLSLGVGGFIIVGTLILQLPVRKPTSTDDQ